MLAFLRRQMIYFHYPYQTDLLQITFSLIRLLRSQEKINGKGYVHVLLVFLVFLFACFCFCFLNRLTQRLIQGARGSTLGS